MKRSLLAPLLLLVSLSGAAPAATYYISTTGSDSFSGASYSLAWATFSHAWAVMHAGDTLLVADGTYHQRVAPTFSGTSQSRLTIRAMNDGRAIIDGDTNGDGIGNLRAPLEFGGPDADWVPISYVTVEGLVVKNGGPDCPSDPACYHNSAVSYVSGNYNVLRRVSLYNAHTDKNAAVVWIMGSDNLVEDCVVAGSGRKMLLIFGSATRNIVRRTFLAWQEFNGAEFDPGVWPWGDTLDLYAASNNIVENSIAYGMAPGPASGFSIQHQGGTATGNALLGNMSVRIGKKWNGQDMTWPNPDPYRTPPPTRNDLAGFDMRTGISFEGIGVASTLIQDSFAWGNAGHGLHAPTTGTNQMIRGTFLNNAIGSGETGEDITADSLTRFNTISDSFIEGTTYQGGGARLNYRYESTFSGNTALPTLSTAALWPWPMESRIASELGVHLSRWLSINPEMQNFSVTNTMQSIFNSLPAAINPLGSSSGADTQAPTIPTGLSATAVSSSQINLSWYASTDNVGVTGYRIYRNGAQIATTAGTTYSNNSLSPATPYTYTVSAYDAAGNNSGQSSPASATTQSAGDSLPPSVSVTSPAAGSILSGNVTLTASATDNVGVAGVQFRVDGASVGAEDTSAPYSISLDTTTLSSGTHALTARARDAAGNSAVSAAVNVTVDNPPQGSLSVANVADNRSSYANSQVPKYSKLEVSFQISNTVATNFQLPYDPAPPAGIDPANYPLHKGISVDAVFTPDDWQTVYRQPAFYYEVFQDAIKSSWDGTNREWDYPTGSFTWKVRFAPNQIGTWQYKIVARDSSGTTESPMQSFSVTSSSTPGFVRVSTEDPRYFEFDNGQPFYPVGLNGVASVADPVLANEPLYQSLAQNHINFQRLWISSLYGSAWLEWIGGSNPYDGYLPRAGLEPFHDPVTGKEQMTQVLAYNDPLGFWYDACRFQFWNDPESVKQNTSYKLVIRYWGTNIAGPRLGGNYGVVGKISNSWVPNCEEPGTGTVITNYGQNTSNWSTLEGNWNSGSYNFLPRVYLALENATLGKVYVSSVSLREDLGNGQYGPEIIKQPSMQYELYFPQEPSYSFDKVVELAERYGVYLKLVLSDKDDKIYHKLDDDGTFVIGGEADNGDGFYGLGRTLNKTRWLQQAWWRYVQARWGYSTAIHSWELTNEGDPFLAQHWELTDEMGKFMRCRVFGIGVSNGDASTCADRHPNRHMVTTSFWHSFPGYSAQTDQGFWGSPKYPNVDYADVHAYISTSTAPLAERTLMEGDAAYYHLWHSNEYGSWKLGLPIVRGEAGMDLATSHGTSVPGLYNDTQGIWYHNYVWSSADSGGLYDMYWWSTPDVYNPGVYDHRPSALSFQNFLSGVPLNNGHYQDLAAQVSDANLRVVGQKDVVNGNAHLWIQNKNHTWRNVVNGVNIAPVSGTIRVAGFVPNRAYTLQWWDTYRTTGQVSSTTSATAASDGTLTLSASQLATDVAVKIIGSSGQNTPAAAQVSPSSGSGTAQVYSFTFSDADGWQDLGVLNVLVNNFLDGRQACYLAYSRPLNQLYLVDDAGFGLLPGLVLGTAGTVSNSQCTIYGATSSASGSGNSLVLTLSIGYSSSFAGNRVVYMAARDLAEHNSGWRAMGVWTVSGGVSTSPDVVGMNPARGSAGTQAFTFTFTDNDGWQDLGVINVLLNSSLDGRQACYLAYSRPLNVLYLVSDSGGALSPGLTLGAAGSVSNSQCSISGTGSSASGSGNTLALTLNMSFTAGFAGDRVFYLAARDSVEHNSGWHAAGTWTVP
jgi:chitodextrinase